VGKATRQFLDGAEQSAVEVLVAASVEGTKPDLRAATKMALIRMAIVCQYADQVLERLCSLSSPYKIGVSRWPPEVG
jgi:hypothetical protein